MKWLLLILLIPALAWAHPVIHPTEEVYKMIVPITGGWQLSRRSIGGFRYAVEEPDPAGQYKIRGSSSFVQKGLIQFDTNIGAGANISSVTITRTRLTNLGVEIPFDYYLGTWAATPPVADAATFNGGTIAGAEVSDLDINTVDLDPELINKTGITSLLISTTVVDGDTLANIQMDLIYTVPARGKWPFRARAE